jgi:hypothetical protein
VTTLEDWNARLKHAVESGQYQTVADLLRRCEREVQRAVSGGRPADRRTLEAVGSVLASLRWARRAIRAARAHDQAALARCRAARPYRPPAQRTAPSIEVQG